MDVYSIVKQIIREVETQGDKALCMYAKRFDQIALTPAQLRVSAQEIKSAKHKVSADVLRALQECAKQIKRFAQAEKSRLQKSWMISRGSIRLGQKRSTVDSTGLYIPGGRFPYPSTVLMTAIPAKVAGVPRIVMATPPRNLTPEVLAAADFAGVQEIYRMGGAGAIAALALGTSTVKRVDFIAGPGNQFVTEAKRQVYGRVGIDSLAGPSEVVVIADHSIPAEYILVDLQAQAEHDPESRSILLITDSSLLNTVRKQLDPRLRDRVQFEKVASIDAAITRSNEIAPEHLELLFSKAERYLSKVKHAGAIFMGPATPAAIGDYVAGPSHVLPTLGAAHFSSGLSVATFMKRSSVIGFSGKRSEVAQWKAALQMAETEGMENHARSLRLRLMKK